MNDGSNLIKKELEDLKDQIRTLDVHKVYIKEEIANLQYQLDEINALIDSMSTIFYEIKSDAEQKKPDLQLVREN